MVFLSENFSYEKKETFLQKFQKSTDIIRYAFSLNLNQTRKKYLTKSNFTRKK